MYYRIRHLTRFRYSEPITESIMEVRMHPRTEAMQRCLDYQLAVTPKANIHIYRDYLGNSVHHFDIPGAHSHLQLMAESVVEMKPWPPVPDRLPASAWEDLDRAVADGDYWEMLLPSLYCRWTPLLEKAAGEFDMVRRDDPLSLLSDLSERMFKGFEYTPRTTRVDSPIDEALKQRKGVCQDFSHIFISLARRLGIPSRYVSGYLHHRKEDQDRSDDGATHAWVECWLPGLGWTGIDPTNNLLAGERHIRTAIGRDYADVPPTRGVFKGGATTQLTVAVDVSPCEELPPELAEMTLSEENSFPQDVIALEQKMSDWEILQQQQQQQ
jgi:transglutaminase-like putative cysteine protease